MKRSEEDYQRFMGFPAPIWPHRETDPRRRQGSGEGEVSVFRHPVTWARWRMAVRRRGPYAPDFKEFVNGRHHEHGAASD